MRTMHTKLLFVYLIKYYCIIILITIAFRRSGCVPNQPFKP